MAKRKQRKQRAQKNSFSAQRAMSSMPIRAPKRQLTLDQEFQIMKLVLDKFLWLGFIIMAIGLYLCLAVNVREGLFYLLIGIIILLLFVWIIVKEYEIITK